MITGRVHPEESLYFSNEPQPVVPANNNAAPSYADLVNLAQQEAQQQAIIDAQKKLETNKIVKDIEFIQKQQDMLQQQIHAQEILNEQKLSHPTSGGSYSAGQSSSYDTGSSAGHSSSYATGSHVTSGGSYQSGQYTPDGNEKKFNDGLYHGEGKGRGFYYYCTGINLESIDKMVIWLFSQK